MRPRLRIIAAITAALALPLALGLTESACFDFDATMAGGVLGDSGPPPPNDEDGATLDGNVATEDGAAPPRGDGGDGGGPVGNDGGPKEGGPAPGYDAGPFCNAMASNAGVILCDSFDDGTQLPGLYFNVEGQTGGTLAKTTASADSPPDALDLKTFPIDDGGIINVALRESDIVVPALPANLTFAFALNPQQIDTTAGAAIVLGAVDFLDVAGNRYSVGLAINVVSGLPALALDEQSGFVDGGSSNIPHVVPAAKAPNMNAWNDIVVTIQWTAPTTATASVTINGAVGLAPFAMTMTVQATSLQVGIGTSYVTQPAPAWELLYDNVSFAD
jgi:hypothetical protein